MSQFQFGFALKTNTEMSLVSRLCLSTMTLAGVELGRV